MESALSPTTPNPVSQDRLKDLVEALLRNPNLPHLIASISSSTAPLESESSPPPYPFADTDSLSDEEDAASPPSAPALTTTLNIDASTHIIGSRNGITTPSPTALAATVLAAMRQVGANGTADVAGCRNFALRIDCGVHVRGDGNLIGAWKTAQQQAQQTMKTTTTTTTPPPPPQQRQSAEVEVKKEGEGMEEERGKKRGPEGEQGGPETKVARRAD